jgi:hypothetical protein
MELVELKPECIVAENETYIQNYFWSSGTTKITLSYHKTFSSFPHSKLISTLCFPVTYILKREKIYIYIIPLIKTQPLFMGYMRIGNKIPNVYLKFISFVDFISHSNWTFYIQFYILIHCNHLSNHTSDVALLKYEHWTIDAKLIINFIPNIVSKNCFHLYLNFESLSPSQSNKFHCV